MFLYTFLIGLFAGYPFLESSLPHVTASWLLVSNSESNFRWNSRLHSELDFKSYSLSISDTTTISATLLTDSFDDAVSLHRTPDGTLLLLEQGTHQIRQYEAPSFSTPTIPSLIPAERAWIGGYGFESGAFANPVSMTITSGGRFLVAETESNRIQVFDSRWIPLSFWSLDSDPNSSDTRSAYSRIRPDFLTLLPNGSVLVIDLSARIFYHVSENGQHRSAHRIPDSIPVDFIRQIRYDGDHVWLLNSSNGELYTLTASGFYTGMSSCGFPAQTFALTPNGVICADSFQFRINATSTPLNYQLTHEIPGPLIDILPVNDHILLLTSRSLYHVTLTP